MRLARRHGGSTCLSPSAWGIGTSSRAIRKSLASVGAVVVGVIRMRGFACRDQAFEKDDELFLDVLNLERQGHLFLAWARVARVSEGILAPTCFRPRPDYPNPLVLFHLCICVVVCPCASAEKTVHA